MTTRYIPKQGMARNGAKPPARVIPPMSLSHKVLQFPTHCRELRQSLSYWFRLGFLPK